MKNLGTNLKNLLIKAQLSENELARRTGVSQQIINRILSGENTNPKIATLAPLAKYFTISISQLIGDELLSTINIDEPEIKKVSLLDWAILEKYSLNKILEGSNTKISVDFETTKNMFALKIIDDSMEPKFSQNTLLIFDSEKTPLNGDFVLIKLANNKIIFRQLLLKKHSSYIKSLNPNDEDFTLRFFEKDWKYLGTLIQSRIDYLTR